ncbi:MAG: exo-beta-N-acetylmuramidase NamZ domain-containing protein [Polyangiaceae bacterium]
MSRFRVPDFMQALLRRTWPVVVGAATACASATTPPSPRVSPPEPPAAPSRLDAPSVPLEPQPREPALPDPGAALRLPFEQLSALEQSIQRSIDRGEITGAVVELGRHDGVLARRALGRVQASPATWYLPETRFDLASLTKPFTALTCLLVMQDQGVRLDARVAQYLPEFAARGKGQITIRDLLLHQSGLPAANPLSDLRGDAAAQRAHILGIAPSGKRGDFVYSDVNFMVLGLLVEQLGGSSLDQVMQTKLLKPLGLERTGFRRPSAQLGDAEFFAPTEVASLIPTDPTSTKGRLQGVVHDPRARALDGVAGHAGLFSTTGDLGELARALLSHTPPLSEAVTQPMLVPQRFGKKVRGLGWELRASDPRVFGHYGFTGTSLWIDPARDGYVVVLTSRLYPDGKGTADPLRGAIHRMAHAAYAADLGAHSEPVVGADVLRLDGFATLKGRKVLLLTNEAARLRDGRTTIELLRDAPNVELVALLSPEHGIDGRHSGLVKNAVDRFTGLPVRSLYADPSLEVEAKQLAGGDTIVFDLQDVGVRFYTYFSTLHSLLRAAAKTRQRVVILDRPNPLGGEMVAGPLVDDRKPSFVHHARLPLVHGLTAGEFARYVVHTEKLDVQLEVIKLRDWRREMQLSATQSWAPPSPNLRTRNAVLLYPLLGPFETTSLSVGRGTDTPFEVIGAPFVDPAALLTELGELPGLELKSVTFVPRGSTQRGKACKGLAIRVRDASQFDATTSLLRLADALLKLYPQVNALRLDDLLANRATLDALRRGEPPDAIQQLWRKELDGYREQRGKILLY